MFFFGVLKFSYYLIWETQLHSDKLPISLLNSEMEFYFCLLRGCCTLSISLTLVSPFTTVDSPECLLLFLFYFWRNWGSERLSNLPGVILLVDGKGSELRSVCGRDIIFVGLSRAGSAFSGAHAVGVGKGGGSSCTQAQMHTAGCVHSVDTYLWSAYHMPGTVPSTVVKTVQKKFVALWSSMPVECSCHRGSDADSITCNHT